MTRYRRVDAPFFVTTRLDTVVHIDTRRTNAAIYLMLGRWIAGSSPPMTTRKIVLATRLHPSSAKPFPRFASASPSRGGRSAERRNGLPVAPRKQVLPPACARARKRIQRDALAFRRFARRLSRRPNARTQPRPRFTRAGGRRRYPRRQSRLSGAPRAPVVMPAGTMPGPPGSGVTSPARRYRTRSVVRYPARLAALPPNALSAH
jgi:hypothetical protein